MSKSESVVHGSAVPPNALPALGRLLETQVCAALIAEHGHTIVAKVARAHLDALRIDARAGKLDASQLEPQALHDAIAAGLDRELSGAMRRVFNLTGTVLHTNLGRATLAPAVARYVSQVAAGPNSLEFDIASGRRGDRDHLVEGLLCQLTGAQAATVVNNNAGAVLLTLAALAQGRDAIVSRGELVEIGGSFRMPDVMAAAGVTLVEVGTTNRTHLQDYERALGANTGLLMKVHTSNYAIQGFTAEVDEQALGDLARRHGVPLVSDLGSGTLVDLSRYGLPREPLPQDKLLAGCDVVTFSGDKLLGGPQAGLIVGQRDIIERIRRHPLKRALRMGQLPMAALEATLRLYLRPEHLTKELPTLRLLTRSQHDLRQLAADLQPHVAQACAPCVTVSVRDMDSQIGSGSLPGRQLPSAGLALSLAGGVSGAGRLDGRALERLAAAWRALPQPVIGRLSDNQFLMDLRCLDDVATFRTQLADLPPLLAQADLS